MMNKNGVVDANESEEEWDEDEEAQTEALKQLDDSGLPEKGPYGSVNPAFLYPIMMVVFLGIGYLIAWGIYSIGDQQKYYDAKVAVLAIHNLGCLYLAVFFIGLVLPIQQVFVAFHRKQAKVENPDQYIFKTMLRSEPYVRLESEGPVGAFNRAQRGIDNTRESFVGVVVNVVFAGYIFPEAVLGLAILYLIGRIAYSAGYISFSRGPGALLSMIASTILGGLQLFATVQIFRAAP